MHLLLYVWPFYMQSKWGPKIMYKSWDICISFCMPCLFIWNWKGPRNIQHLGIYMHFLLYAPSFGMQMKGLIYYSKSWDISPSIRGPEIFEIVGYMHLLLYARPFCMQLEGPLYYPKSWDICISFCMPRLYMCNWKGPLHTQNLWIYASPFVRPAILHATHRGPEIS